MRALEIITLTRARTGGHQEFGNRKLPKALLLP
jgi:hypothetical protein